MGRISVFKKGFIRGYNKRLPITSEFGMRFHPIHNEYRFHNGIDIGVPQGTVLEAPLSGKVTFNGRSGGGGLKLTIRHQTSEGDVVEISYFHLSSIYPNAYLGYSVSAGQVVAASGGNKGDKNAGDSTGAHLHLGVTINGTFVDPAIFLSQHDLFAVSTGKMLSYAKESVMGFNSENAVTQANIGKKRSPHGDITVKNQTEYDNTKKNIPKKKQLSGRLANGIWQITKILVDSSVSGKQVLDSGISTQQGSLLNFFRKVCQEPMVEFMGDTFGNQYYWIARKPPFDREGWKKNIELTMRNIPDSEVITTDLTWNNSGIYSWYKYIPYADLINVEESNLYVPAIFFPEFASVWGSRPLAVESNYYNWVSSGRFNSDLKSNAENGNAIIRNAVADLKYIVESNAYNAFTRRGTITLQGDRRIKRGTVIHLDMTGEVFHVDAVSNNFSVLMNGVTRTTTIQVSRGIFPKFVEDFTDDNGNKQSYFSIIDFGKDFDIEKVNAENCRETLSKWKVNTNTFSFFLSRQQLYQE